MQTHDIDESTIKIELLLRNICFVIRKKGRSILEDFNITPPQFEALQFLACENSLTISELSSKLYLATSTVTDLVDRLERAALVKRTRSTRDRRVVIVEVLEKGYELIDNVVELRCASVDSSLSSLSHEEKLLFIKYLEILNNGEPNNILK